MRAHTFLYEEVDPTREDLASVAQWLRAEPDQIEVHIKQEPIDKFLGQIKEMYGTFGEFPKDERRTNKILRLLKQGATPMPMYVEQGDKDLFVMEGRHRMVAFWLAGMKTVPVAYASKKLDETINRDILDLRFNHTQEIGDYTLKAETKRNKPVIGAPDRPETTLHITCFYQGEVAGSVEFEVKDNALESGITWVAKQFRSKGVASTMYAYAKMLGNDIRPSGHQLPPGKLMWNAWRKSGEAQHLVAEDSYQPPTLHTGDKILKGRFKNSPAEIKGFGKDKHNQPTLRTNKGDIQLFKPRVTKLMTEDATPNMSTEDMIAYLKQHHDTNLHPDYLAHLNTFSSFVLKNIPINSIKSDLSGLDKSKVEQYRKMDFSKAPPIVMGDGYILDGYHRVNAAMAMGIPTIKGYVGLKGESKLMPKKLDEYEGSVYPTENSKAIFSKLEGLGYSKLGSGADATVWAKDSDHVIKILMPRRTLPSEVANAEKGFLEFYNFCKDHSDVPNLPRFIDIGGENHAVFEINGTPYRQIAMERLQHIPRRSFEEAMVWMLSDLAKNNASWGSVVRQLRNPRTWSGSSGMTKISDQVAEKFADPAVSKQYGILYLTMSRLYHSGLRSGLGWDLHTDNVMMRRDGTLVIVDPYFT